jgi:hypothetical protein
MLPSFLLASPRRTARLFATAIAALSLSACGWDCGTVTRTTANGPLRDAAGATLATAQVDLSENVGPSSLRLSAGVMGPAGSGGAPLRGRVTRARLVTEGGELIAEIPTGTATLYIDAVVALTGVDLSRSDYDRVRRELMSARARVILETTVPGREVVEAVLTDVRDAPGEVGRCSPQ